MCQCAYVCLHICSACVCGSPVFDRMLPRRTLIIYLGFSRMLYDSYCWLLRSRLLDPMLNVWRLSTTLLSSLSILLVRVLRLSSWTFRAYMYWDCPVGHSEHVMIHRNGGLWERVCTLWKSQTGLGEYSERAFVHCRNLKLVCIGLVEYSERFFVHCRNLKLVCTGLVEYSERVFVHCRNLKLVCTGLVGYSERVFVHCRNLGSV